MTPRLPASNNQFIVWHWIRVRTQGQAQLGCVSVPYRVEVTGGVHLADQLVWRPQERPPKRRISVGVAWQGWDCHPRCLQEDRLSRFHHASSLPQKHPKTQKVEAARSSAFCYIVMVKGGTETACDPGEGVRWHLSVGGGGRISGHLESAIVNIKALLKCVQPGPRLRSLSPQGKHGVQTPALWHMHSSPAHHTLFHIKKALCILHCIIRQLYSLPWRKLFGKPSALEEVHLFGTRVKFLPQWV